MAFDLVIFDCDGVLIDSEVLSARKLVSDLAGQGVTIDLAYVSQHLLGRSFAAVAQQIDRDFGVILSAGFEDAYRAGLLAQFETDLEPLPGVADVLATLRCDYCVATSSSPRRVARSLALTGLDRFLVDRVSTADEVANGKPAPDLFQLAARKRGAAPDRCLVIEDSPAGIAAGLAAGMTVWRFTGGSHLQGVSEPAGADRVFKDFKDMRRLAPALFSR